MRWYLGTSIAAITSIHSRARRLIGASFLGQRNLRASSVFDMLVLEYPLGRAKSTRDEWLESR